MKKLLSAAVCFLISLPILAATKEMGAADASAETVDVLYVVIFGVIFIGMIVGFFVYLWWTSRSGKTDQ